MAPSVTETVAAVADPVQKTLNNQATSKAPLELSGALKEFASFDVTPVIGTEFPTAKLKEWLNAPNSDELIRDLAITSK
jgi:hypothetical protein